MQKYPLDYLNHIHIWQVPLQVPPVKCECDIQQVKDVLTILKIGVANRMDDIVVVTSSSGKMLDFVLILFIHTVSRSGTMILNLGNVLDFVKVGIKFSSCLSNT